MYPEHLDDDFEESRIRFFKFLIMKVRVKPHCTRLLHFLSFKILIVIWMFPKPKGFHKSLSTAWGLKTGRKTIEVRPHVAKMTILKSFLTNRSDLANFDHSKLFFLGLFCTCFLTARKVFIFFRKIKRKSVTAGFFKVRWRRFWGTDFVFPITRLKIKVLILFINYLSQVWVFTFHYFNVKKINQISNLCLFIEGQIFRAGLFPAPSIGAIEEIFALLLNDLN